MPFLQKVRDSFAGWFGASSDPLASISPIDQFNANLTPPRPKGPMPTSTAELVRGDRSSEVYSAVRANPYIAFQGRIENPDEVLRKMGSSEGLKFYSRMLRQFAFLGGIIGQRIDGALKLKPTIMPGDASDEDSVRVAYEVAQVWEDVPEKVIVLRKMLRGVFFGFAPVELIWGVHPGTGVVAPLQLIDRPPENFVFDIAGNPRFLTVTNPLVGEPIDPLKFMFLRGGSRHTPYGEAELKEVYLATWYIQTIQQFGLEAVEKMGQPLLHVHVPKGMDQTDKDDIDNFMTKRFGTYIRTPTEANEAKVDQVGGNITAAGAAGRSEFEIIRYYVGWIYIRLLRTQQTQDKTGGSRALESTRQQISSDAMSPDAELLCDALNYGWMKPIIDFNYPNMDPKLKPRFVPDPTMGADEQLMRRITDGIDRGIEYSKEWFFKRFSMQEAKNPDDVLGHPKTSITETTQIAPPPPDDPGAGDETAGGPGTDGEDPEDIADGGIDDATEPQPANLVGVLTNTGQTMYFDADRDVLTANRGLVPFRQLAHGDEPVTIIQEGSK